jgi:hypothetical protein
MLEELAKSVGEFVFGLVLYTTGWGVLRVLTRGRWTPSSGTDEAAICVGCLFYVAIGLAIWLIFRLLG